MFLEDLPRLPLEREIEVSIEVLLVMTPVSQAPYKMVSTELVELKAQL